MTSPRARLATPIRLCLAALLGVAIAIAIAACGSSGHGLIPEANAGPLQGDFEAIAQAAQTGDGNCTATTAAINKAERDFATLPATVDAALRNRLSEGISNLRSQALALCAQPLVATTTTSTPRTTTTRESTHTPTPTPAPTATTPTTTTPPRETPTHETPSATPPSNGGGTAAPKPSESGSSGGTGVEETEGSGSASGGQEGSAK